MQLAVVTSRDYAQFHEDDRPFLDALAARGVGVVPAVWDDARIEWQRYDAIVIRTPWDYYQRIDEFLPWLARVEKLGVPIVNPASTLRWNADKRYLLELEADGWDIVGTHWVDRNAPASLASIMGARGWRDVVVKPAISGGAWRTFRVSGNAAAHEADFRTLVAHGDVLVQPYVPEIETAGEWSLLFFGGEYSHAVLKMPRSGDFRVQEKHGGEASVAQPPAHLVETARRWLARLPALGHPGVLYARVDGVVVHDTLRLMELELIEPQLFLTDAPEAGARYADVLLQALRSR